MIAPLKQQINQEFATENISLTASPDRVVDGVG